MTRRAEANSDMSQSMLLLPGETRESLLAYRRLVRRIKLAETLFSAACGLLVTWLLLFLAERFIDTSAVARAATLVAGTLGFTLLLPARLHRWFWNTRRLEQVAQLLKRRHPAIGDQLLGVVELVHNGLPATTSLRLAQAAVDQVNQSVKGRDFADAVPNPRHRRWAVAAAVPAGLAVLLFAVVPAAGWNTTLRWLLPWSGIPRYTFATVQPVPQSLVLPHGEDVQFQLRLQPASRWRPSQASAAVSGRQLAAALDANQYSFSLPGRTQQDLLQLRVGDWTGQIDLQVAERPELKSASALVTLPAYLQYSRPVRLDIRGGAVSILKGSLAAIEAEISRDLSSASINGQPATVQKSVLQSSQLAVTSPESLELQWQDVLGLAARTAFKVQVNAVDDRQPDVQLKALEPQAVVLDTDAVKFDIQSRDDFGLKQVGLEWRGVADPVNNPEPQQGSRVVERGSPEMLKAGGQTVFCAATEQVAAQTLELRAWAEDYLDGRGRVWSSPIVIHVMTAEQHAVWLMEQLRRWAGTADDVYEEEMRLHDVNRQIRQMTAEQFDQPAVRRQIEQQAAAEKANGQRLDAVVMQGEDLIRQAMRNREILAGHVETWAQGLQKLQDISQNRMPSVAKLLSQAAASRSAALPQPKGPQAPAITDVESGFNAPDNKPAEQQQPTKPSNSKLGLPSTVVQGGPQPPPGQNQPAGEQPMEQSVHQQADLLAEFLKVREQLQMILDDLEDSTFVKRFKAASREQLAVAESLNRSLYDGFGVQSGKATQPVDKANTSAAARETAQSQKLRIIQDDLQAYADRRNEAKFARILKEMEDQDAVSKVAAIGEVIRSNRTGESISRAELWADTLDRWAEELVSPSKCGQCKPGNSASLPPEVILEVMRILEGEMDLREQTRATQKTVDDTDRWKQSARELSAAQQSLYERVADVITDIEALPNGGEKFGREIGLLEAVGHAMGDAWTHLQTPRTDGPTIAAETEAIELLLQTRRANPRSGGGGGGSSPGGGGSGSTDRAALEHFGPDGDAAAVIQERKVQQTTGNTGDDIPAEYRDGIDAFFNAIDGR